MLKIWAVLTVLVIFTWDISSAQTRKGFNERYQNELEGSGYPDSSLHDEHGSGSSSGDFPDSEENDQSDEDEEEANNHISEGSEIVKASNDNALGNEVGVVETEPKDTNIDNRVALASTNNNNGMFASTEMLAAMIAGGTIGLLFAILLILLLVYRMRKKDEGSYDLSKKPIYKKAPTTEFYA